LVLDTDALPEARARQLEQLAQSVLGDSAQQATHPDAFGYELTIETAQDRRVIAFEYADASDALKQLIKELRA
jgi:hypothetical protein